MHRSTTSPRSRTTRFTLATLVIAALTAISGCVTPTSPGTPPATQKFCEFWEKVEEAPPAPDNAVLVKDDVVALAEETEVVGSSCTDSSAKVELDGAVLAEGEEVPAEIGNPDAGVIAAVTGDEIGQGQPVLDNVQLQALSAEIGLNGIKVRGNVLVRLSGQSSTIGFVGTLTNLDNWSVNLSSTGLSIPGIVSTPVVFNGTLRVQNGVPTLTMSAQATQAKIGDITLTGASLNFVANPNTGLNATVQGAVKVGPSTASGVVDVTFDKAGNLVAAKADIAAHLIGTQAGGKKIDLQGTVNFTGNAQETAISFTGSGIVGDLQVHHASGDLTLAANKATFIGVLDVAQGANYLRYNGSIVWDGVTAYTPFLYLEAGGEYSGTLADGQTIQVSGDMSSTTIGGQTYAVVTGDFKVGTLRAQGSAIIDINGPTTVLEVDANLVNAGFNARIEGAVQITDGRAEMVQLDASVDGALTFGDVTMTGAQLSIRSTYGSPLDLSFSGALKVGSRADLVGSVDAVFGPNGTLLALNGQMTGSMLLDSWGIANFNGAVVASPEQVTLSGSGTVQTINFPLGVSFNGSFTSSRTSPSWTLHGSGRLRIASLDIASARLSLTHQAGMQATRAGFYFSIIGISTYFEGNFYMKPGGGCSKVDITQGNLIARGILALTLPGIIGCPVNV